MTTAAETWDDIYASGRAMRWWPSEDVLRFSARRLGKGSRVLEVGCGNGANTWGLADGGCSVVAIDASSEAIQLARRYVGDRQAHADVEFHVARHDQLRDFPGETVEYDAIVDCRVSQHLPWSAHLPLYQTYRSLLKPGGWLFLLHLDHLTTDARRNDELRVEGEESTWGDIAEGVYPGNGLVCMPPVGELRRVVVQAGLKIARLEQQARLHSEGKPNDMLTASHVGIDAQRLR